LQATQEETQLASAEHFILKKKYRFKEELQLLHFSAVWIADDYSKLTCGALAQFTSMYKYTLNCTCFLAAGVRFQFKQLVCDSDSG